MIFYAATTRSFLLQFFVRPSQIAKSLIDNSNQTYGGQSINICTHEKDNVATNRTWIKKKDCDLQRKKLINLQGHFH